MRFFRNLSIRTKMTLLACVSAGVALLLMGLGFALYGTHLLRRAKVRQLEDRAKVLAFYSAPVVTIRDETAGERLLASLRLDPTIEVARIFDRQSQLVASFGADQQAAVLEDSLARKQHRFIGLSHVELVHPVQVGAHRIGSIYLRANTKDLQAELSKFLRLALAVFALAMNVAVFLSTRFQRAISRPILALTDAAHRITTDKDYSIRAECGAGAELGTLEKAFNRMLDRVQMSEFALKRAHDQLEERVVERTRELSQEITRRQAVQTDLEKARDAAEAASRAKSDFLANMSHEIRTPLNAIVGFAELLLSEAERPEPEEHRDYLATIHKSSLHLLDLISDILDLSKIEAGRLDVEPVDCSPHQVIAEVISVMRVRAREKGLSLDHQWMGEIPETVRTDPARLRQLLINLIGNAIKFTEEGEVRVLSSLANSATSSASGPTQLRIEVSDTGIGIPAEKLETIFDPFSQADNSVTRKYGGTGLGLAICRKITSALGGELHATSGPQQGSTFEATIATGPLGNVPMLQSPWTEICCAGTPRQGEASKLPPADILIVDDGETNCKLIQLVLRRAGVRTSTAENGEQALLATEQQHFDLILMDMQMPVMDGYSATRCLREQGMTLPIVALTAHAMKGDREKCLAAGCSHYLTKPINGDRLLEVVAEALADAGCEMPSPNPPVPSDAATPSGEQPLSAVHSSLPMDDPDFCEIAQEFKERLQQRIAEMKTALAERNADELRQLAHWLKGAGGTAGFDVFTEPARSLGEKTRAGRWQEAGQVLEQIADLTHRIEVPRLQAAEPVG